MKKKNILISVFVIAIILISTFKLIEVKEINLTNIQSHKITNLNYKDNDLSLIKKACILCSKCEKKIYIDDYNYKTVMKHIIGEDKIYYFSFDYNNKKVYLLKEGYVYEVNQDISNQLYLSDNFNFVYINATAPKMNLLKGNKIINLTKVYNWTFKKINNSIKEDIMNCSINENINTIKIENPNDYKIDFEILPDDYLIKLYKDNVVINTGKNFNEVFLGIENDSKFYVEIEAKWNKKVNKNYYGTQILSFIADLDFSPSLEIISDYICPGDPLLLMINNINNKESVEVKCTASNYETKNNVYSNRILNIIPISFDCKPGKYELCCAINKGTDNEELIYKSFTVEEKSFKTKKLNLEDKELIMLLNKEDVDEYKKIVEIERDNFVGYKLWEDKFILPINGDVINDYGDIIKTDKEKSYMRSIGLGICTNGESVVKASNNGIVVVSEKLSLTGNTVVIDHGMGIYTSYYNLGSLNVFKNMRVNKGDIIGSSSNTMFFGEKQLYFELSLKNNSINPYSFFTNEKIK